MRARFQLRCLGEPALLTIGGRPVKLRTRKQLALLCYLGMEKRWHARDVLAELLWPDRDHSSSRHSLAVALSGLRGKLGREILESVQERVRLHPQGVEVDVDRLLIGDVLGSDTEVPLDVDGFLEGFEVPEALPFAHWRDAERARLLPNVLDALVVLIDRCRRTGDFRQIETMGLRLQRFEPLSEHAMRARMEARAFAGDRLTALRLFEQWKLDLDTQLHAAPSDLLEGMALRLRRRGWERPGSADIPTVHTDQWKDRPFVGRAREYRELYEAWEGAQRCEASHRLILGDSGIGKSTLVERLTTAAGLEGATVARVQCHEAEREIPYTMVSGLIAQLVERPGASATPPESLAELAQTIPAVRQRFPVLPLSIESQGDAARIRFTEAAHALMAAVAEEHPVILVVDDVHHADDVSLAVLHRIIRLADRQAILVYFLARLGELNQSPQAARLRDHGASLNIHQLALSTLPREESADLLDALLKELELTASPTVRRTLLTAAAGYPLVLELLVRDWARSGDKSLAMALDAVTADTGSVGEPDEAYRLLVERLMSHLDPTTRNVLNVAAVLGPRLNDAGMYALADLKVGEVMTGLTKLSELRILRDAGPQLEFGNDLIRAHGYLAVPPPVRRLLHNEIATSLITRAQSGEESLDLEIAWHCMRCGRPAEATQHLLAGARSAIAAGAIHDAERRLASGISNLTGVAAVEATLLLSELLQEQGRWAESLQTLESSPGAVASVDGQALRLLAEASRQDFTQDCLTALHRSTVDLIANTSATSKARTLALRLAAVVAAGLRDVGATRELLSSIESGPHSSISAGESSTDIDRRLVRAFLEYYSRSVGHRDTELLVELEELANQSRALERPSRRSIRIVAGLACCQARMANYEASLSLHKQAVQLAIRLEDDTCISTAYAGLGLCYHHLGDWNAQHLASSASRRHRTVQFAGLVEVTNTYLGATAHLMRGETSAADALVHELEARMPHDIPSWLSQLWLLNRADILYSAGRERQAAQSALRAFDLGEGRALDREAASALTKWVVRIAVGSGSWPLAERFIGEMSADGPLLSRWDEAERTAALLHWTNCNGHDQGALRIHLVELLRSLPVAAGTALSHFGLPTISAGP